MNLKKSILQSWLMKSIIEKMSSDLEICFPLQLHKRKISSLIFKQELCSWLYFSKFITCRNTRLGFDPVMTTLPFSIWGFWLLRFHLLSGRVNRSVTAGQRVIPLLYTWWIKIYICLTLEIFSFEIPHQIFQVLISLDIALVACPTSADTLLSARDHRQGRRRRRRRGD